MRALLAIILLILLALGTGCLVNWLYIRLGTGSKRNGVGLPCCGRCGYTVRGISKLVCPECGADLREVGINMPGQGGSALFGCLIPVAYSIVIFIFASLIAGVLSNFLPTYSNENIEVYLSPGSDQYDQVSVGLDATFVNSSGSYNPGLSLSSSSFTSSSGQRSATISITGASKNQKLTDLYLKVDPKTISSTASMQQSFNIDPITRVATWNDSAGKSFNSAAAFASQDVLAFLGSAGADITRSDVQLEAQELHALLDGLANGMNQFQLNQFSGGGSSSSSMSMSGPTWYFPTYFLIWFVIWIVGLVLIARKVRKGREAQPEQNP